MEKTFVRRHWQPLETASHPHPFPRLQPLGTPLVFIFLFSISGNPRLRPPRRAAGQPVNFFEWLFFNFFFFFFPSSIRIFLSYRPIYEEACRDPVDCKLANEKTRFGCRFTLSSYLLRPRSLPPQIIPR